MTHRRMRAPKGYGWVGGLLFVGVAACSGPERARTLHVYAASSLTEVFRELEAAFESDRPDTDVLVTFAGSQILRVQIEQGADADVFASANPEHLRALEEAGRVRDTRTFAQNELVVIAPPGKPAQVASFADLVAAERLVVGTENVPVGSYAREALLRATPSLGADFSDRVLANVVSEEANARLVRAKVEIGEADAAIVYRTDVHNLERSDPGRLRVIPVPEEFNVRADYQAGVVRDSDSGDLADAWLDFVSSRLGREILSYHGFLLP